MLFLTASTAKSSPSSDTRIEWGTTPSSFPSTTVSTRYPSSNWRTCPSVKITTHAIIIVLNSSFIDKIKTGIIYKLPEWGALEEDLVHLRREEKCLTKGPELSLFKTQDKWTNKWNQSDSLSKQIKITHKQSEPFKLVNQTDQTAS